jgi:hypothetical protein
MQAVETCRARLTFGDDELKLTLMGIKIAGANSPCS